MSAGSTGTDIRQFYLGCLSQASYLVTDRQTSQSVVVDPLRDVDQYLDAAQADGSRIVGVVNTHFHADFVSGNQELAARTGAWTAMGARARADFDFRPLADDSVIDVGDTRLRIWHTPGHTPESVCILVGDRTAVHAVLTGDTLFIGDVGRPDLAAADGTGTTPVSMARELHRSLQRLRTLDDGIRVLPAHGAGSSCGKNLSTDTESTIGRERATNPMFVPMPQAEFVAAATAAQPAVPAYFPVNAAMNKTRHQPGADPGGVRRLTGDTLRESIRRGAQVVDVRSVDEFAAGHLAHSVNIGFDGRMAETAGMVLDYDRPIVVAASEAATASQAILRLRRVGLDDVIGIVVLPTTDLDIVATERLSPSDLHGRSASRVVVDVRGRGEIESTGTVAEATIVPLPDLTSWLRQNDNVDVIRERGVVVFCAGGWRSSVAASVLRARTGCDAIDVVGGYTAIAAHAMAP